MILYFYEECRHNNINELNYTLTNKRARTYEMI